MTIDPTRSIRTLTASTLLAAAAIHVAWGRGSSFPFSSQRVLTDNVAGSSRPPSPAACATVATGLAAAAAIVAVPPRGRPHRATLGALAAVFAVRAMFGFAGRTNVLVPGSDSSTFRRNDRRLFSPLCAALAVGVAGPLWRRAA